MIKGVGLEIRHLGAESSTTVSACTTTAVLPLQRLRTSR